MLWRYRMILTRLLSSVPFAGSSSSSAGPSSSPTAPTTLSLNSHDADPADSSMDSVAVEDLWSSDDEHGYDDDSRDYVPSPVSTNITRPYRFGSRPDHNVTIGLDHQRTTDVVGHQIYACDYESALKFRTIVAAAAAAPPED